MKITIDMKQFDGLAMENNFLDGLTLQDIEYNSESEKKFCCNKEMIELKGIPNYSNREVSDEKTFICGECGSMFFSYFEGLDNEELINYMESCEQELKGTPIYNELKGDKE